MNVILFGATGMVGQGVLRECMLDPEVERVLSIVRSPAATRHLKLRELVHDDFLNFSPLENDFAGHHACFFCLGVSSAGMAQADYERITYGFTLAAAQLLARLNRDMTFVYVSGRGTDSSERGRVMWARVKGRTENALLGLPFKAAYMFRPGVIVPLYGIKSKTKLYRASYALLRPLLPLLYKYFPQYVTTTEQIGRAMLKVVKHPAPKKILESSDINQI